MSEYVSVIEFAKLIGKSDAYVRRLCRENKVPHMLEQLQNSSNNKYMIDISSPEAQKKIQNNKKPEHSSIHSAETSSETIMELLEQIRELENNLGKQEGKAVALEDIRKRDKDSAEAWEKRYFDLQESTKEFHNNITELNKTIAELKAEIKIKDAELERYKPFWKKMFEAKKGN